MLYDFHCEDCDELFDHYYSIHDHPPIGGKIKCDLCEGENAIRIASVPKAAIKMGSEALERTMADKVGLQKDRELYTLEHHDPYAHMRPEGDKEQTRDRLRRSGTMNHDNDGNYTGKKIYPSKKTKKPKKTKSD
jgi:hypothetical protein